ncbi:MAG: hypothetical protein K2J83_07080, partial [Clostridia bacterium]|nr:hypothetical protein [Clostridia bacterium]
AFTTTNPKKRYIRMANVKENNNLRDIISSKHYLNDPAIHTATDKFYGHFYVLGMMNDFTEMVKKFLSESDVGEQSI